MKKTIQKISLLLLAILVFLPVIPTHAAVDNWQKGISIRPRWDTDFASDSFKQTIDQARDAHVNYITLIIPYKQANIHTVDMYRDWNTPTDEALISAIHYIHSKGAQVNVKIHLESDDGQWRANINPGDRDTWFSNYQNILSHYATLAQNNNVEQLTLGAELINMSAHDANWSNTQHWYDLIGHIRTLYSGTLTYSANWGSVGDWVDEKNRIHFWNALDYIGVSAYYPLPTGDTSVESYKALWDPINKNDIVHLHNRYGKQILFTEIGYRSMDWAQYEPFNYWGGGGFDEGNQARLYEALFSYWNDYSYMVGVHLWDWKSDPSAGGQGNIDFTPQHKQAIEVMTRWFAGGGESNPPSPAQATDFSDNSSVLLNEVVIHNQNTISTNITNNNGNQTVLVDIEIYNDSDIRVHQDVYTDQTFATGATKNYTTSFTPTTQGVYTIKIGIFANDWSQNFYWNNESARFSAIQNGGTTDPPPPTDANINIWWPGDGSTISGVQPFKAMVEEMDVNDYLMYWQVDGDKLNLMNNSDEDYPHKQSLVDVSNWGWKGVGPYRLNFVAQDHQGQTFAESSRDIKVY